MSENYYDILNVPKTATAEEIKKAYRELAKKHHPDRGGDEEHFKKITKAYETLSNEELRREYDNPTPQGGINLEEFFRQFTGQAVNRPEPINTVISLTIEEAYTGVEKKFKINRKIKCEDCDGNGGQNIVTCPNCNGHGFEVRSTIFGHGHIQQRIPCSKCQASGKTYTIECKKCKGHGSNTEEEIIELQIPKGVPEFAVHTVAQGGHFYKNYGYGDIVIQIRYTSSSTYSRVSNNLIAKTFVDYTTLVLGGEIEIKLPDQTLLRVKIPKLTNAGDELRVVGKGFTSQNHVGDLILSVKLKLPTVVTEKHKELLEEYKKLK